MRIRFVVAAIFASFVALPAVAQPLFANPLDTAAGYRAARGATSDATQRYRYEITAVEPDKASVVTQATFDIGSDWALFRMDDAALLYDFRLNRQFVLKGETFTSVNGMASLVFRVMERQNRTFLGSMLSAVGADEMMTECGTDTELGLALSGQKAASKTAFEDRQGAIVLTCDGQEAGGFKPGSGQAPAAFWPTLFNSAPMHPAQFRRMRESGAAPQAFDVVRGLGAKQSRTSFKLLAAEVVVTPYPLTDAMRNTTAETFDTLIGPGGAALATGAVAGTVQGGPPTLQSWGEKIEALMRTDPAAAGMLMLPTLNMFPELQCARQSHPVCNLLQKLNGMKATEPAPMAAVEMAMAAGEGDMNAVITSMQTIMASRHRDSPAAAASFALALMEFKEADLDKAKAAGLPTDVKALQAKALMAFPYNVAYWTDAGDPLVRDFHWPEATLFYDVAHALPMPNAVKSNGVMMGKRNLFEKIRKDFPDAFLPG